MKQQGKRWSFRNHTAVLSGRLLIIYLTVLFKSLLDGIFRYRFRIAILYFIVLVAFEINGSSISVWDDYYLTGSEVEEYTLYGTPRIIRSDEWAVNTPMLLSQYLNGTGAFPYFSDTIRGTQTDAFIIYGQPVRDIAVIFRPFHWGYLFLSQGQGLSFFWMGRFIALFLVTLELSLLLTKKNKLLSVATTFLITFAPTVQWWFAINGLVEMLVFGQLAVLLIYYYMKTDLIWKRSLYAIVLAICAGGYILTLYPAWMIPLFYIFLAMAVAVIILNYRKGIFSVKDLGPLFVFLILLGGGMAYIVTKSADTIMTTLNTAYPGARLETGGDIQGRFFQYIGNVFFPYNEVGISPNVCEEAVFFDFFPLGIIFAVITLCKQKKKDVFLISLLVVNVFLGLWCIISWPEWLAKITLLSSAPAERVHAVLGVANIFLLVRSLSLGKIRIKPPIAIGAAALYTVIILFVSKGEYGEYFTMKYMVIVAILLMSLSVLLFLKQNRQVQSIFAVFCMGLSLVMGATVNPIEQGVGALMEQPVVEAIREVAEHNDGIWIAEGLDLPYNNIAISAGAPTINATNVYPYLERWEQFDEEGQYSDIYNRYAHIEINLQNSSETDFVYRAADRITVNLNMQDLYKLDATYILTGKDLTVFDTDGIKFNCISAAQGFYIYEILFDTKLE